MISGEILPSSEEIVEQMKNKKKGTVAIYPRIHMGSGKVGKEGFDIAVGVDGSPFIEYKGRTVRFDIKDLISEAVSRIEEKLRGKNEMP